MSALSPSLYAADPLRLLEEVTALTPWAESFHLDLMDGRFTPEFGLNLPALRAFSRLAPRPLDVHLMLQDPAATALTVAELGVRSIALHLESDAINTRSAFCGLARQIQSHGVHVHAALQPATPLSALEPVLEVIDGCLLLTAPAGGGAFDAHSFKRLAARPSALYTAVDGRIDASHFQRLTALGVDLVVIGAALFQHGQSAATAQHYCALLDADQGRATG